MHIADRLMCCAGDLAADFTMKDTSGVIPNSARLGGSSGRIEKTVPLGAWYDPAVSLHATRASHDSDLNMRRFLELTMRQMSAGPAPVRYHWCWQPHVCVRLRSQGINSPGHHVRRQTAP